MSSKPKAQSSPLALSTTPTGALAPRRPFHLFPQRLSQSLDVLETMSQSGYTLSRPERWLTVVTGLILLGVMGAIAAACLARLNVVVQARGQLDTVSQTQPIQSQSGGIVTSVLVEDGQQVKQGQLLVQLDKTSLRNQRDRLRQQVMTLKKQVEVLRAARQGLPIAPAALDGIAIAPELMSRVQTRALLLAQLSGDPSTLNPEQQVRYQIYQQKLQDQTRVNSLTVSGLETQIASVQSQVAELSARLTGEENRLQELRTLVEAGAIAQDLYLQRVIEVNEVRDQLNQAQLRQQELQLQRTQSDVQGRQSLTALVDQVQQQLTSLDAEFESVIEQNQQQLLQAESDFKSVEVSLRQQDLVAPVDGTVFQLSTKLPGVVVEPGQPLLQVVPQESLVAKVLVPNREIVDIRPGTPVDLQIDAYPFTDFGVVPGVVSRVSSQSIQQDGSPETVFSVEVQLDQQFLLNQSTPLRLVPGMDLSARIVTGQRAPIEYVIDPILEALDSAQTVQ